MLALDAWPGDWQAAGIILQAHGAYITRSSFPPFSFSVSIGAKSIFDQPAASGAGFDTNALTAIFRAFVLMRAHQVRWEKQLGSAKGPTP